MSVCMPVILIDIAERTLNKERMKLKFKHFFENKMRKCARNKYEVEKIFIERALTVVLP